LKAQKPAAAAYPKRLKILGDHLRKRRLDLKLFQKEVAKRLGTSTTSIYNWENNQTSPSLYSIPKIIKFLGYIPDSLQAKTLGEKIITSRRLCGLTQKELTRRLDIDPSTLARSEKGKNQLSKKELKKLDTLFTLLSSGHLSLAFNPVLLKSLRRKGERPKLTRCFG